MSSIKNYSIKSEAELLREFAEGSHAAFSIIFGLYSRQLIYYARKNIQNKEDCEEIVQDVFVSLWERRESLEIQSLKHYLFNAVRYKVIRYMQHEKVKRKYAAHFRIFEALTLPEEVHPALAPDILPLLEKHIVSLPERCQYAFRLRLYENLSNPEIAQRMQITKKTVEVYMFKAFSHLRNAYAEIGSLT